MGWGDYANDTWELYHTDTDRSECHDLAADPDRLRELVNLWHVEAGANGALPLDDRSAVEVLTTPRPVLTPPRSSYTYAGEGLCVGRDSGKPYIDLEHEAVAMMARE
jgi:arylsulfatase